MTLTSIAGVVGNRDFDLSGTCGRMLTGMRTFGADPDTRALSPAEFGSIRSSESSSNHGPARRGLILAVIDGRVDNHDDLCAQLRLSVEISASELLAAAWQAWSTRTLDRLRGDYAFAVFDQDSRKLWLARDPAGYRPLFHSVIKGARIFSSMPSGIHALGPRQANWNHVAVYAGDGYWPADFHFWEGIMPVPTGTLLCLDGNDTKALPIVDPSLFQSDGKRSWQSLVSGMRTRLEQAVSRRLVDTAPLVGGHLSSGLDSTAVMVTAARLAGPENLVAYTAAPSAAARLLVGRGREANESALASMTADRTGFDHVVVRDLDRILPSVRGLSSFFEQPAPAQYSFPWWRRINDMHRERGGRTLLTAGHGNATLSYGGIFGLARLLREGHVFSWLRECHRLRGNELVRWRGLLYNSLQEWIPDLHAVRWTQGKLGPSPQSFVRKEWRREETPSRPRKVEDAWRRLAIIRDSDAGAHNRGMFALTGIEERDPSSDRDLLEFSLSLPPETILKDGRIKPLIRDVLADEAPAKVLNSRKRGLSGADWYDRINAADCRDALEDIEASGSATEILDIDAIRRAVDRWPAFDSSKMADLTSFGQRMLRALSTGLFLAETDRYPLGNPNRR